MSSGRWYDGDFAKQKNDSFKEGVEPNSNWSFINRFYAIFVEP